MENTNHGEPRIFGNPKKAVDTRKISYAEPLKHYSEAEKSEWAATKASIDALKKDIHVENSKIENLSDIKTVADFTRWIEKC
jgi:hypothetical protein